MSEERRTNDAEQGSTRLGFDFLGIIASGVLSTTFLIAVFIGILNLLGAAYYEGYINQWGLNQSLFPATFESLRVAGFVSFWIAAGYTALWGIALAIAAIYALFLMLLLFRVRYVRRLSMWISRKLERDTEDEDTRTTHEKKIEKGIEWTARTISFVFIPFFVSIFSFGILIAHAEGQGKEQASIQLDNFKKSPGTAFRLVTDDKFRNFEGHLIRCSNTSCAIYRKQDNTVQIVRRDEIEQASFEVVE